MSKVIYRYYLIIFSSIGRTYWGFLYTKFEDKMLLFLSFEMSSISLTIHLFCSQTFLWSLYVQYIYCFVVKIPITKLLRKDKREHTLCKKETPWGLLVVYLDDMYYPLLTSHGRDYSLKPSPFHSKRHISK